MRVILQPSLLRRSAISLLNPEDFCDLEPTKYAMNVRCMASVSKLTIDDLRFTEPAKEQEQVSFPHTLIPQMRRCRTCLTEGWAPSLHSRRSTFHQIWVEVDRVNFIPIFLGGLPQLIDQISVGLLSKPALLRPSSLAGRNRKRQHSTIRKDWAWHTTVGGVKALSAQYDLHVSSPFKSDASTKHRNPCLHPVRSCKPHPPLPQTPATTKSNAPTPPPSR